MKLYFKPEWRIPTAVGVTSFVAGTAAGVLGLKFKQKRDDEKMMADLREVVTPIDINQMKLDFKNAQQEVETNPGRFIIPQDAWKHDPKAYVEMPENGVYHKLDDVELKDVSMDLEPGLAGGRIVGVDGFEWPPHLPEPEDVVYPPEESEDDEEAAPRPVRTKELPYVISQDEFFAGESGLKQGTLEYFTADDIVCDEDQVIVYNYSEILGDLPFGQMSGDSNVVYIRNEKTKGEWEVVRRPDESYQETVLAIRQEEELNEDELRHSNRVLKFRD